MPATIPTPLRESLANYPPAIADQLVSAYLQGRPFWLTLAIDYTKADAAVLFTVPSDGRLFIHRALWEVGATAFTGGASSAIGLSSDATGFSTKGDILGGATGDVAATLTANTLAGGTAGAKFGSNGVIVIPSAKVIRFDRITSAFTAGSGYAHLWCSILPTS